MKQPTLSESAILFASQVQAKSDLQYADGPRGTLISVQMNQSAIDAPMYSRIRAATTPPRKHEAIKASRKSKKAPGKQWRQLPGAKSYRRIK